MIREIPFQSAGIELMNEFGKSRTPFLFLIDYAMENAIVLPIDAIDSNQLCYDFNGKRNFEPSNYSHHHPFQFDKYPVTLNEYRKSFDIVMKNIRFGNSFLTNLTFSTPVYSDLSLKNIFYLSNAYFKLWFKERFTFYSPEKFVSIKDNTIRSFPMKGTIDASVRNAKKVILDDEKEKAEHYTIVDLIRNDLSLVAKNVRVERFRYIDTINTNGKTLLQVSSEIAGELEANWNEKIGFLFRKLLPAGSITGAPKKKTVEIIGDAEKGSRGFYTGVAGIFDGKDIESAVMIRFVEYRDGRLFYHSGGGITVKSNCYSEYREMIEKVYVPFN